VTDIRGRVWRGGKPQDEFEFASISDYLVEDDTLVWCDIYDPSHATLKDLANELELDNWAVEDAIADAERTKAVVYRTHTFFTVYSVAVKDPVPDDDSESMLDIRRISGFVLPRGLITVRLSPHFDMDVVSQRFDELGGQEHGVGALVHGLLDVIVDGHFEAVQWLDDGIESVEDDLFANNPRSGLQRKTFRLRKDLVELRRVVLPMREVVNSIQHRRLDAKTAPELDPLYADLYDHVLRVSEWTESVRDMVTTVFETNLSLQDARLNTVMKKLTGWAAIIAVPTAITGFYGQNVTYPGIDTVGGFVTSTSLIALTVLGLYWMFKRRDWL
jgi:magnesium transporter